MELSDLLALPLGEGIEVIKKNNNTMNIEIRETNSYKKDKNFELNEPRILKILNTNSVITIVVGYF